MPFVDFQPSNVPPWMQGPNGKAWLSGFGTLKDYWAEMCRQGVKARFPTQAPADALTYIGDERGLPQGPSESSAAYALRLRGAWESWTRAGSPLSLLLALYYAGYTNTLLVQQNGLGYQLQTPPNADPTQSLVVTNLGTTPLIPGTPSWWTFDPTGFAFCSRFELIFPQPLPASWTNVISPATPSTAPSLNEITSIQNLIKLWRPAKATCVNIAVVTSGECLGWPVQTLVGAGGFNLGPSTVVYFGGA